MNFHNFAVLKRIKLRTSVCSIIKRSFSIDSKWKICEIYQINNDGERGYSQVLRTPESTNLSESIVKSPKISFVKTS